MKITRENAKKVALVATASLGVGVAITVAYYAKNTFILKEAKWTPEGDMVLSFYHRANSIILPKPE